MVVERAAAHGPCGVDSFFTPTHSSFTHSYEHFLSNLHTFTHKRATQGSACSPRIHREPGFKSPTFQSAGDLLPPRELNSHPLYESSNHGYVQAYVVTRDEDASIPQELRVKSRGHQGLLKGGGGHLSEAGELTGNQMIRNYRSSDVCRCPEWLCRRHRPLQDCPL